MSLHNLDVGIYNFNDEVVQVKLVTLAVWASALQLEQKGLTHSGGNVSTKVRKFLSAPRSYKLVDLYAHIKTSYDSVMEQIEEYNK